MSPSLWAGGRTNVFVNDIVAPFLCGSSSSCAFAFAAASTPTVTGSAFDKRRRPAASWLPSATRISSTPWTCVVWSTPCAMPAMLAAGPPGEVGAKRQEAGLSAACEPGDGAAGGHGLAAVAGQFFKSNTPIARKVLQNGVGGLLRQLWGGGGGNGPRGGQLWRTFPARGAHAGHGGGGIKRPAGVGGSFYVCDSADHHKSSCPRSCTTCNTRGRLGTHASAPASLLTAAVVARRAHGYTMWWRLDMQPGTRDVISDRWVPCTVRTYIGA